MGFMSRSRPVNALNRLLALVARGLKSSWTTHETRRLIREGKLEMGEGTYGVPRIYDYAGNVSSKAVIGRFCSLGANVKIILGGEHRVDWVSAFPFRNSYGLNRGRVWDDQPYTRGDVVIHPDVWIGNDVLIRSGVIIGPGAVVGAGSVVTRDVKPYEIVGGNPARLIRARFSEDQVRALLRIAWWEWPLDRILQNLDLISSDRVDQFIDRFGTPS